MAKGKTKLTLSRESVREALEAHVKGMMLFSHDIGEMTVHKNGSVDLTIVPRPDFFTEPDKPLEEPSNAGDPGEQAEPEL